MHLRPLGHLSRAPHRPVRHLGLTRVSFELLRFGALTFRRGPETSDDHFEDLRREWDSNPRWAVNPHLISNQVPSATRTSLRRGSWQDGQGLSRTVSTDLAAPSSRQKRPLTGR